MASRLLLLLALWFCSNAVAGYELEAAEWDKPRNGELISHMPPLQGIMAQLQAQPQARLELYHPGGDAGRGWAEELRDWLVALGLSARRIDLQPGNPRTDIITITITRTGGKP